jgi:hypothetical protein
MPQYIARAEIRRERQNRNKMPKMRRKFYAAARIRRRKNIG